MITLPPSNLKQIHRLDDINSSLQGHYIRPVSKTWAAVDSWMFPNKFFQITTLKNHDIEAKPLNNLLSKVGSVVNDVEENMLIFAVPPDVYNSSWTTEQTYVFTEKGHTVRFSADNPPSKLKVKYLQTVEQYVLEVPLFDKE